MPRKQYSRPGSAVPASSVLPAGRRPAGRDRPDRLASGAERERQGSARAVAGVSGDRLLGWEVEQLVQLLRLNGPMSRRQIERRLPPPPSGVRRVGKAIRTAQEQGLIRGLGPNRWRAVGGPEHSR